MNFLKDLKSWNEGELLKILLKNQSMLNDDAYVEPYVAMYDVEPAVPKNEETRYRAYKSTMLIKVKCKWNDVWSSSKKIRHYQKFLFFKEIFQCAPLSCIWQNQKNFQEMRLAESLLDNDPRFWPETRIKLFDTDNQIFE